MNHKSNISGTTNSSFKIGKESDSPTIHTGDVWPANTIGIDGDIFIICGSKPTFLQKNNNEWHVFGTKVIRNINTSQEIDVQYLEELYLVDTTGGTVDVTVPTTGVYPGSILTFKDVVGSNTSSKKINIVLDDGSATVTLSNKYAAMTIIYNGSGWTILNSYDGVLFQ